MLVTVCADCHESEAENYRAFLWNLLLTLSAAGIRSSRDLYALDGLAEAALIHCRGEAETNLADRTQQERLDALASALRDFQKYKDEDLADGAWYWKTP